MFVFLCILFLKHFTALLLSEASDDVGSLA